MDRSSKSPKEHISAIFEDYEASARVLQTLTNLSNTVIETALSGQCKFLFEILQNADDAFDDSSKYKDINLQLVYLDDYFIIQHNGKMFNYYDVERICDYASQIEEVKANDLSKTGYKGLGFKSLFNLSDCIYIYSNGYSFRFDKKFWPEPEKKPWQVIPIWCDSLPLSGRYTYDQPVNFIMKINDKTQLDTQLKELIDHPEFLLYLHRVSSVYFDRNGIKVTLERKIEKFGVLKKIVFVKNQRTVSTWLSRTYEQAVSRQLKKCIREVSQFIYPDKIKNAEKAHFTFTLCTNQNAEDVFKVDGFCYSTLPTQLKLSLPYHVNSLFILNLDRTQFHENEWNEFLIHQIGYFQLNFLKDLAEMPNLKNFVIDLLVRKINHPYGVFNRAFSKGFEEAKNQIAWLPAYKGYLLKLGEACVDKIHFFKQNFQNIQDRQSGYIIDHDVKKQDSLFQNEAECFNYDTLFQRFSKTYYPQLTESSYKKFLSYIYEISQVIPLGSSRYNLENTAFLKTKNRELISPKQALLEVEGNPIPDFAELNPVDNKYLPGDLFKNWLVNLGAKRLNTTVQILRESVFRWINSGTLQYKINIHNHSAIISYLANNFRQFTYDETETLKKKLLIFTKSNKFAIATSCYLPNAITLTELEEVMSDDKIISSCYDICSLKTFFSHLGISDSLSPIDVFRKCIFVWIENGEIRSKLTLKNYKPILEFLSSEYQKIEYRLTREEKAQLRRMPVLTSDQIFQEAKYCYFDTAVPNIKGFEDIIEKSKLVSTQNLSNVVHKFLLCTGVNKEIDPLNIIRSSVLKWIQNGTVQSRINSSNHYDILKYVADLKQYLYGLQAAEINALRKLPVLTKSKNFREVCTCFWQIAGGSGGEIPELELIISADELISSKYYAQEKERPSKIETLLNYLGARHLEFTDIYDRYCDHLKDVESMEWFFSNLIKQWEMRFNPNKSKLLNDLKSKLPSSQVLSKNGKVYHIAELYSSHFLSMYSIDKNAVPLLPFENLPTELEKWLGIKQTLELPCIVKLLEAFDTKQSLGEDVTFTFFKTLLVELQNKDKAEIKKYPLKLLSKDNKLTTATSLYYFKEEDAECLANSCYLKRIHGMSHNETLKLAELCGVNLLKFSQEVSYGKEMPIYDKGLCKFYLERLPLIVLQESKELNESSCNILKKLFREVKSIELYKCQNIFIKYPFGKPVEKQYYFDLLKIHVVGNWKILRTKIHEHIKEKLAFKTDIREILDMESVAEDKVVWLRFHEEDPQKLLTIEENLKKLLSGQEIEYIATENHDFTDEDINIKLPSKDDVDLEKIEATTIDQSAYSRSENINNDLFFKQDIYPQVTAKPVGKPANSVDENIDDSFTQDSGFDQVKSQTISPSVDSENKSNNELLLKQNVSFGQVKTATVNQSVALGNENIKSEDLLIEQDIGQGQINIPISECSDIENRQNVNFGLEKPTYDNTLKEFYLQRLPAIIHLESKKQKHTPKKVLKSLYKRISSIELYQCSDIHIQYPYSYVVDTYCFFDDLKIYVVGRWPDRRVKIHQYIKERLGLHTDVADIINVQSISEIVKKERISPEQDESQELYQIEEEIKTLLSTEEPLTNELQVSNDKEHKKNTELLENEEFIAGASSDENSKYSFDYKSCLSRPYYSMQFEGSKMLITFAETAEVVEPTSDHLDEDGFKGNVKLTPRKQSPYYRNRARKSHTSKSYSLPVNLVEPDKLLHDVTDDESQFKKLGEKYVFIFLQNHYKNKYPDAQINTEHARFTLHWQLQTTEIIWLNDDEDKGLEYDLLLKKNEEVKQYVAVKSVNQAKSDLFNMIHSIFARRNKFATEHPEYNAQYCIYCILYEDDSSLPFPEEMTNVNALYKIASLKLPSV